VEVTHIGKVGFESEFQGKNTPFLSRRTSREPRKLEPNVSCPPTVGGKGMVKPLSREVLDTVLSCAGPDSAFERLVGKLYLLQEIWCCLGKLRKGGGLLPQGKLLMRREGA